MQELIEFLNHYWFILYPVLMFILGLMCGGITGWPPFRWK
ncbi:hypothetical protein L580_2763 [Serratia fonticola AU-P3(3)]|nr:hypothetical protein L580_2763 [Serratia fonticola AU-P3(3)]